MEIKKLKEEIKKVSVPRRTIYGNIRHKLEDIIIIGLCTVICGGEAFADMEEFGKSRKEYLAEFPELPNGIPCHKCVCCGNPDYFGRTGSRRKNK